MPRTVVWKDLKIGLIAMAVIIAAGVSILLFARIGALHGDTSNLFVVVDDAPGVLPGTDVWISGKRVGVVEDVHFRPVSTDSAHRLAIHTRILKEWVHLVRKDSRVDIRPAGNLIGSPVVFIRVGTSGSPAVQNNDTLFERPRRRLKPLIDQVTAVAANLDTLMDSTTRMMSLFTNPRNSIGAFQQSGVPRIQSASAAMARINNQRRFGSGTLGLASRNRTVQRIALLRAQLDSIKLMMKEGRGSIGRFRSDSTLGQTLAHLSAEADSLRLMLSNAGGTAAKMRGDSSLSREMTRARLQLDSIMADVKKHPTKYIQF